MQSALNRITTGARHQLWAVGLIVTLAGCATTAPVQDQIQYQNPAVRNLVQKAEAKAEEYAFDDAAAYLERALRIEPVHPGLWYELARLNVNAGEFDQAEAFALRADSLAGGESTLRRRIWELIADVRHGRGDAEGARQAIRRAHSF